MNRHGTDSELFADLACAMEDALADLRLASVTTRAALEHAGTDTATPEDVRAAVDAQVEARQALRDIRDLIRASRLV